MEDASPVSRRSDTRIRPNTGSNDLQHPPMDLVVSGSTPPNSPASVPVRELLCYSPSPLRRSRTRLGEKLEVIEDLAADLLKRRSRNRSGQLSSPRNVRRSRRRLDQEEREICLAEEAWKVKKRRNSGRTTKRSEKLSLNSSAAPSSTALTRREANSDDLVILDRLGVLFADLVMWRDVAKSSLWFGFGCLCFLSSCFTSGLSFSIFSGVSQLGLLYLGVSFISNTIRLRNNVTKTKEFMLTEDDVLRAAGIFLPYVNFIIAKGSEIFSGEPSMTLKVVPVLLLGAQYGHLFTIKRMCALGFFTSFTVPRLYSCYDIQIKTTAEFLRWWIMDAWRGCNHKKIVAGSAVTAFWNLASIKTRIVAAFIALVVIQYKRHYHPESEHNQDEHARVDATEGAKPEEKKEENNGHSYREAESKGDDEQLKVVANVLEEEKEENKEHIVVKRKSKKKKQLQVEDEKLQQAIIALEEDLA